MPELRREQRISNTRNGSPHRLTTAGRRQSPTTQLDESADYLENWDEWFLCIAVAVSRKSKDPRCRVGAVIVSDDRVQLSMGFNGLARGVFDDKHVLNDVPEKLRQVCHAEENAVYNAARIGVSIKGATIVVTKFPCFKCCIAIVQAGITRIYTHDHRFWDDDPFDRDHTRKIALLKQARIQVDAPFHPTFTPQYRPGEK
jgi:dCMP deaminase